jgi:RNA polymerase subunit RPABC4/transcription elongation factor Spt4
MGEFLLFNDGSEVMALKPCRECKKEVSTEATVCPHCGTPKPTTPQQTWKDTLVGLIVVIVVVGGLVTMCSDSDEQKKAKAAESALKDAQCNQDLSCIGDRLSISMTGRCVPEIERLAKNSVKWTDETLEPKFSRLRWTNAEKTMVTLIGDKAQFQNGFGAYVSVIYQCDVDIQTRTVFAVRVNEGRL